MPASTVECITLELGAGFGDKLDITSSTEIRAKAQHHLGRAFRSYSGDGKLTIRARENLREKDKNRDLKNLTAFLQYMRYIPALTASQKVRL